MKRAIVIAVALTIVLTPLICLAQTNQQLISGLIRTGVIDKIDTSDSDHPAVFIGPNFYQMSYRDKANIGELIYQTYRARSVHFYDRSGRHIARYGHSSGYKAD